MLTELWKPDSLARSVVVAGAILLAFLVAMLVVHIVWRRVVDPLARKSGTDLDDLVLPPVRGLLMWGIFLTGAYHSTASLSFITHRSVAKSLVAQSLSLAWLALAVWTALRIFNGLLAWYCRKSAERYGKGLDMSHQAGFLQKVVDSVILAIGLIYALRIVGVDVSPLLASGAIGGLAVALALQDTLSNFFAGLFMAIDRPVKVGDYVRLESGEEGFIDEIGWRNTKVRPWANNLIIVPNATLSKSRLTNFYLPHQETSVSVPCGVAYDSDLEHVEHVTVEVARDVMGRVEGSDTEWNPVVRWKEFGEYAISFVTTLRVKEFSAQYRLQSEFIKALHRRYSEEGIEIPSPASGLLLKGGGHRGTGGLPVDAASGA